MSHVRPIWQCVVCVVAAFLMAACGGAEKNEATSSETPGAATASRPSGKGVCGLIMQDEVDQLFGQPAGAGEDETLDASTSLCSWPDSEDPRLLLQVGPRASDIRDAVALGEGYRVSEVAGMSGPAAAAIQEGDAGLEENVAVLALETGERTIVISPIGLGVREGTPGFERLKEIVERVATRL